jgi:hypothetical protein
MLVSCQQCMSLNYDCPNKSLLVKYVISPYQSVKSNHLPAVLSNTYHVVQLKCFIALVLASFLITSRKSELHFDMLLIWILALQNALPLCNITTWSFTASRACKDVTLSPSCSCMLHGLLTANC